MGCRLFSLMLLICLFTQTLVQTFPSRRSKMMYSHSCPFSCPQTLSAKPFYGSSCFCTKSCMIYGDCCSNALYQNTDSVNLNKTWITLQGLGPVLLVSSCPSPSSGDSETCYTGLEKMFPVTSKVTGTTYANYHCALCNKDISNLIVWPVTLRCSEEKRSPEEETLVENFVQDQSEDNDSECLREDNYDPNLRRCKLYAVNEDLTFTKSLELRKCVRVDISKCWPSWDNETTKHSCYSYLDPVRGLNGVYRNKHCAECSGEKNWIPVCSLVPNYKAASDKKCGIQGVAKLNGCKPKKRKKHDCPEKQIRHKVMNKCVNALG